MISTLELRSMDLEAISSDYKEWGGVGIYGQATLLVDRPQHFWRIVLSNNPAPPGKNPPAYFCFNVEDVAYALSQLKYYESLVALRYIEKTKSDEELECDI